MWIDAVSEGFVFAQGTMPRFDGMYWVALVSRTLHILSAAVLVGGLFYLRMVIAPRLRTSDAEAGNDPWFAGRRGAWAMWVGIASLLLIATGLFNYLLFTREYELAKSYHMVLGIKMLLALVVFFFAAVLAGRSGMAEQLRQKMKLWLGITLILAMIVVAIGSFLRSYPHTPKPPADGPALLAPTN